MADGNPTFLLKIMLSKIKEKQLAMKILGQIHRQILQFSDKVRRQASNVTQIVHNGGHGVSSNYYSNKVQVAVFRGNAFVNLRLTFTYSK